MKKLFLLALTLLVALSLSAAAQEAGATKTKTAKKAAPAAAPKAAKAVKLTGKISDDGKTFTNDKDNSAWTITNAADDAVVKGHSGHHVTVSAHPDAAAKSIHIASLTMVKEKAAAKPAKATK